ncbi:MAG TPA: XRE family transcriptional regulator [Phycisphaerales bacterium]|nr:XRE family transcriptional regulator [Phycisphaerales bacterium]
MQLKSWLKANNIKQRDFAVLIGATDSQISRICCGQMVGSPKIIHMISKATNGQVSACDIHAGYIEARKPTWARRANPATPIENRPEGNLPSPEILELAQALARVLA